MLYGPIASSRTRQASAGLDMEDIHFMNITLDQICHYRQSFLIAENYREICEHRRTNRSFQNSAPAEK